MKDIALVEQSVIACLLLHFDQCWPDSFGLKPDCFQNPLAAKAYQVIVSKAEKGDPVDYVTVGSNLGKDAALQISFWLENYWQRALFPEYVKKILVRNQASQLGKLGLSIANLSKQGLNEEAIAQIAQVSMDDLGRKGKSLNEFIAEIYNDMHSRVPGGNGIKGIPTGFYELDQTIGGLQKQNLIVLGARTQHGKTALALNLAWNSAQAGHRTGVVSLEIGGKAISHRLIASVGRINYAKLTGVAPYSAEEKERLELTVAKIHNQPLFIFDQTDMRGNTMANVLAFAKRKQQQHNLELIIVDHIQHITQPETGKYFDERIHVSRVIERLHNLSLELNIPIIAVSQASRSTEHRDNRIPRLTDLKESGKLEEVADIVLLLYRLELYSDELKKTTVSFRGKQIPYAGMGFLKVAKNRNGESDRTIPLTWRGQFQRFDNYVNPEEEP